MLHQQRFGLRLGVMALAAAVGLLVMAPAASADVELYASPGGSGSGNCTQVTPCNLVRAQARVRELNASMTQNINVNLAPGTYDLSSGSMVLQPEDSGSNGFWVVWRKDPGLSGEVVFSGGVEIAGWSDPDSDGIWQASVSGATLDDTRQIYVNGARGIRSMEPDNPAIVSSVPGWSITSTGFTAPDPSLDIGANESLIEIVDVVSAGSEMHRCGVAAVSGTAVTMKQPCWDNGTLLDFNYHIEAPTWLENAFQFIDSEGEWFLDRAADVLYYKPRASEMSGGSFTGSVIAAKGQTLVSGVGTSSTPLHNVQFREITFAYATWLAPNSGTGFIDGWGGTYLYGSPPAWDTTCCWALPPAAVSFEYAQSLRFERNRFLHLGAGGLSIDKASQVNTVIGNVFTDISGSGLLVGGISEYNVDPPLGQEVKDNLVSNNYVLDVAKEYFAGVGIFDGYTDGTVITHNDVEGRAGTGIWVGFGWGEDPGAVLRDNQVTHNLVSTDAPLFDNGGIYAQSAQPGTVIGNNYIVDSPANIYLDDGSAQMLLENNVIETATGQSIFLHNATGNTVQGNYYTTTIDEDPPSQNTITGNTFFTYGSPPAGAQTIIDAAGLEPAYEDIKGEPGL